MAEFFALLFSLIFLVLVFLPILTFFRLVRVSREIEALSARVSALEESVGEPRMPQLPQVPQVVGATRGEAIDSDRLDAATTRVTADTSKARSLPEAPEARESPEPPEAPAAPEALEEDLEERIGGRGLLYTGVFVLLLGISFFLKYAFDNAWINETARAVIGSIIGVSLVLGGLRLAAAGLSTFGQALVGTGFAVLYLVVYAALNFYYLIGRGTAFGSMVLLTVGAALVANTQRAQALAFIAVGGGFLTPALVGGDEDAQLTLFSYDAVLVLGTMMLAFRHRWFALNALSYAGTFLTVVAWAGRFYTDDLWLRTLLFLTLFCVAFLIILRETRRSHEATARAVAGLLSTGPVFYHLAAVIITAEHPPAIHIYLIAFTAAGLWLTADPHRPLLRVVLLLAAFIPMFGNLTLPAGRSWLVANIISIVAVASLHIISLVDRVRRQDESLTASEIVVLHLAGLGTFSLLYGTLQPAFPGFRGALAVILAIAAVALGRALRPRDESAWLNALALAFTLTAIAIAVQFDGPAAIVGWAAEGVAVAWSGVRSRHRAFQFGGLTLWILAAFELFDSLAETPAGFTFLLNTRALTAIFVVVSGYVIAWRLSRLDSGEAGRMRVAVHIVTSLLTLAWITAEIQAYWDMRVETAQAHLYEQMLLSLSWGLYGAALIFGGMQRQYAPLRYIGITIIGVTALKVLFYDLWELGGIYRVVGFTVFGVILVLVSYLYQRRKRAPSQHQHPAPPPSP